MTTWIKQTLNEFGRSLGFEELTLDEQGALQLEFERLGVLAVECGRDSTMVYLKRSLPYAGDGVYRRALEMCHYSEANLDWLQAAIMKDGQLALATRVRNEDFQLSELESVITALGELHDELAEAS